MSAPAPVPQRAAAVAAYKDILRAVLDARPSGTRQRLADALAKNRSFITQIANPAYATPIPGQHLDVIFDICHFSARERADFMAAYHDAHPGRLRLVGAHPHHRKLTLHVPDLGDTERNKLLDEMLHEVAQKMAAIFDPEPPHRRKP